MKKLILFDIDGTLYDNKNATIYPSTIEALRLLKENNHHLVIASGRGLTKLKAIDPIRQYFSSYILVNGQLIIHDEQIIYQSSIDQVKINKLIITFKQLNIDYDIASATNKNFVSKKNFNPKENIDDVFQIWCYGTKEQIKKVALENKEFSFIPWGKCGYDVVIKHNSKAFALQKLAKTLNISIEESIAIGDGANDIELIKAAGVGICMGNGIDEAKKEANIITDNIEEDGLYKAFKRLNLI